MCFCHNPSLGSGETITNMFKMHSFHHCYKNADNKSSKSSSCEFVVILRCFILLAVMKRCSVWGFWVFWTFLFVFCHCQDDMKFQNIHKCIYFQIIISRLRVLLAVGKRRNFSVFWEFRVFWIFLLPFCYCQDGMKFQNNIYFQKFILRIFNNSDILCCPGSGKTMSFFQYFELNTDDSEVLFYTLNDSLPFQHSAHVFATKTLHPE